MDEFEDPSREAQPRGGQGSLLGDSAQPQKAMPIPRRLALVVAAGVLVVLALGWAVDSLGTFAPAVHFTNGETRQAGLYRVALTLNPAQLRVGQPERFTLAVTDLTGHAVDGLQVPLRLSMVTMEMPAISATAAAGGNGIYAATATTSMSGEWQLDVTLTPLVGSSAHTQFDLAAT